MKKEKKLRQIRLICTSFFIVGAICVFIGLVFVNNQMEFINKASSADGIIIGIREDRGNKGVSFRPVVQFQLKDGRTQTVISRDGSNPSSFEVGSSVKVLYDSENPQNVKIDSFRSLWLMHAIFLILGATFIVFAVCMRNRKSLGKN